MKKLSEFIWEKTGAIAIASLIGAIYGLIVSPLMLYLFPQITLQQVIKVFCLAFSAIGVISSKFLVEIALGVIYTIAGFFVGLGAVGGSASDPVEYCIRNSFWFMLLGIICGAAVFFLYGH